MGEREERCGTCRFWVLVSEDREPGHCHRFPPQLLPNQAISLGESEEGGDDDTVSEVATWWECNSTLPWGRPVTGIDDFCGEWQARKPLPVLPGEGGAT